MAHPSTKPRPSVDDRLLTAIRQELLTDGYSGLTIESVAAASGVAKTTIYRRWKSKPEMVFALALSSVDGAENSPHEVVSDCLDDQLTALAAQTLLRMDEPVMRAALPGIIADMLDEPALRVRFEKAFIGPARHGIEAMLAQAHQRGELPSADGAELVHATLLGTCFAWIHLFGADQPPGLARVIAAECRAALSAINEPRSIT